MARRRYRWMMVMALAAAMAMAAGCRGDGGSGGGEGGDDWKALYERWEHPQPIPSFRLVDQDGKPFRLGDLADRWVLVGFIYTRCPLPEACPLTIERMREVQRAWRERGVRPGQPGLHLLGVTLDPEHDTPERLREYARARDLDRSSWTLATGPAELVGNALPSLFNVLALPRGPGNVQHTVKVALLAPGLTLAAEWKDNTFTAADVLDAIDAAPGHPAE